ncbi:hypothetical protein [Streptomyces sp. NBC_00094]|uniref:hypothetical protein n=1 Tax=Streptomyces sp. NBC_00094 TaxID=2903620 RepID=UPI002256A6A6|nr:hypothetical protein [Streptomyces sp. NBC_00094]MCX5390615.1 hypothetical protein [Streptomyces sp. NBC_00094]
MTASPSLVLRGSGSTVLRFEGEGGAVSLGRPGEDHRIPLGAIAHVRAEGRVAMIELTAPTGVEPASYRVEDVSEAAATAFADAVNAALPERTEDAVDGSTLVTTHLTPPTPAPARRRIGTVGVVGLCVLAVAVALCVTAGVAGGWGYAVTVLFPVPFALLGAGIAGVIGHGLYAQRAYPKHGITVMAEFSHYDARSRVYRYADTTGAEHTYNGSGGQWIELSYLPRAPHRATTVATRRERIGLAGLALFGVALGGGGLFGVAYVMTAAFAA